MKAGLEVVAGEGLLTVDPDLHLHPPKPVGKGEVPEIEHVLQLAGHLSSALPQQVRSPWTTDSEPSLKPPPDHIAIYEKMH